MITDGHIGYKRLEYVLELIKQNKKFGIYVTHKNTEIIILDTIDQQLEMHQVKFDRLPWKILEGKRIATCKLKFNSEIDDASKIDVSKWNNKNQILIYEPYNYGRHFPSSVSW